MKTQMKMAGVVFFVCFLSINAQASQPTIKNVQALQQCLQTEENVLVFAKATLEDSHAFENYQETVVQLKTDFIESDNQNETVGEYLSSITDNELRECLKKNFTVECNKLLNDFFKTKMYEIMREKIEAFVSTMLGSSFLTSEESKKLLASDCYYPDAYTKTVGEHGYKWEYVLEKGKPVAVCGKLNEVVGLKGSMGRYEIPLVEFVVWVDVEYKCVLGKNEKRQIGIGFPGSTIKNWGVPYDLPRGVSVEAEPSLIVKIAFFRDHSRTGMTSMVLGGFDACGYERVALLEPLKSWHGGETPAYYIASGFDIPSVWCGYKISHNGFGVPWEINMSRIKDFIIQTPDRSVANEEMSNGARIDAVIKAYRMDFLKNNENLPLVECDSVEFKNLFGVQIAASDQDNKLNNPDIQADSKNLWLVFRRAASSDEITVVDELFSAQTIENALKKFNEDIRVFVSDDGERYAILSDGSKIKIDKNPFSKEPNNDQ